MTATKPATFQAPDQTLGEPVPIHTVEIILAQILKASPCPDQDVASD
jgi:hypothetical protein